MESRTIGKRRHEEAEPDKSFKRLSEELEMVLVQGGFRKLLHLHAAFDDHWGAFDLVRDLAPDNVPAEVLSDWADELMDWRDSCEGLAKVSRKSIVLTSLEDRVAEIGRSLDPLPGVKFPMVIEEVVDRACRLARHRCRRERLLSLALTEEEKLRVETQELHRWRVQVVALVLEAELPVILTAQSSMDPERSLLHIIGSRRAKTVRSRVRCWIRVRAWLIAVHSTPWPKGTGQMLDYLHDLEDDPKLGRTVPNSVAGALAFFESVGGCEEKISENHLWTQAVLDVTVRLQQRKGEPEVRKAPMHCVSIIMSMELVVVSSSFDLQMRRHAWYKLIKVFGGFRFDDTLHLPPSRMILSADGLRGLLLQSKTTGPDKKVKLVHWYIWSGCTFAGTDWLRVGFELWKEVPIREEGQEAFLVSSASGRDLSYCEVSALSRQLYLMLPQVRLDELGNWELAEAHHKLILPPLHIYFTEHSDRHDLTSWAAMIGIEKSRRQFIARWGVASGGSDDYVLTSRQVVAGVQREVCKAIQESNISLSEAEVFNSMKDFLRSRGVWEVNLPIYLDKLQVLVDGGHGFGLLRTFTKARLALGRLFRESDDERIERDVVSPLTPVEGEAAAEEEMASKGLPASSTSSGFGEAEEMNDRDKGVRSRPNRQPSSAVEARVQIERRPSEPPFWVSISGKRGFKRLHRRGGCWLDPTVDVMRWEPVEILIEGVADAKCKLCWKRAGTDVPKEDSSTDSSSSSDEEQRGDHEDLL